MHEATASIGVEAPFAAEPMMAFLAARALPGVEHVTGGTLRRSLRLPHGPALVELGIGSAQHARAVPVQVWVSHPDDVPEATSRCRRLLDADAQPHVIDRHLERHRLLAPLVAAHPGMRVPGATDGDEIAVRAVLGQQISVSRARALAGRLTQEYGERLADAGDAGEVGWLFPTAARLAEVDPARLPMPRTRARALTRLCLALAQGEIRLDPDADRVRTREALLAISGIGRWTVDYIAMRALGDPDVFLAGDLGVRRSLQRGGAAADLGPAAADHLATAWRPWRSYAVMHLWSKGSP